MSKRLRGIFFLSLLLIYIHGFEEIFTGFMHKDSFVVFGSDYFNTTPEIFYWFFHIIWWLLVPVLYLLFKNSRLIRYMLGLYGLVFFVESHHIIKGLLIGGYYPGMVTAFFYPLVGFLYWKQLVQDWKAA